MTLDLQHYMIMSVLSIIYEVHTFSNFSGQQFLNSNVSEIIQFLIGPLFTIVIMILNGLKPTKNDTGRITELGEEEETKKLQAVELQDIELQKVELD